MKLLAPILGIVLFYIGTCVDLHAQAVKPPLLKWTDVDGRVIHARFHRIEGEAVVVMMNGKSHTLPFAKLSLNSVAQAQGLWKVGTPRTAGKATWTLNGIKAGPSQKENNVGGIVLVLSVEFAGGSWSSSNGTLYVKLASGEEFASRGTGLGLGGELKYDFRFELPAGTNPAVVGLLQK